MRIWPEPDLPVLPGRGPGLRLYDSADRQIRPTAPGATATMYVCGITPYDATHLGHAATYLAFDLINRVWRDNGHRVHYVQKGVGHYGVFNGSRFRSEIVPRINDFMISAMTNKKPALTIAHSAAE